MVDYCKLKMSGSEEEFESQAQSGMSKAELRRSNKPIMEKRRRARINQCLNELKSLILEAMKKDPSRHSKLEKADILEMTVKHLQTVQRQQLTTAVATDPAVLTKFRTGFSECANEVSRYVNHLENVDTSVKQRLVSHLNNCVNNFQQMAPFYSQFVPYMPERLLPEVKVGFQSDFHSGDENNNASARIQIPSGVQLIPSRLPTGELALLVPQSARISANFPFFPPAPETSQVSTFSSAFTPVQRSHSPLLSPSTSTSSFGEDSHHQGHFRQSESPNHQHHFKVPEQSSASSKRFSSPEPQKPHISSSTDRKSPISAFVDPRNDLNSALKESISQGSSESFVNGSKAYSLRQPLSVITDKAYNRAALAQPRRENLKRNHSDGLLTISDKTPKYHDISNSSSSVCTTSNGNILRIREENFSSSLSVEYLSQKNNSHSQDHVNGVECASALLGAQSNGDMWRPW